MLQSKQDKNLTSLEATEARAMEFKIREWRFSVVFLEIKRQKFKKMVTKTIFCFFKDSRTQRTKRTMRCDY
jgi:hypothetical protein